MAYAYPVAVPYYYPVPGGYDGRGRDRDGRRGRSSRSRSRSRDRDRRGRSTQQQLENRRTGGDSSRTAQTIFVSGIHPKVDDMDLFEFFSHAGRVDDIQLIKDARTGKSKGLAYIEFSSVDEAHKAALLTGQLLGGYPITIVVCTPLGAVAKPGPVKPVQTPSADSLRLYVGSLHYSIEEKDIEPIFEAFGKLESVEIHRDAATGASKGFGFISFRNRADGETAMAALNGYEIAGRTIKIGYANPTDGPNSKNPRPAGMPTTLLPQSLLPQGVMLPGMIPPAAAAAPTPAPAAAAAASLPALPPLTPAQLIPSSCVLVSNMFDPVAEAAADPEWARDLEEDVRDEVEKYGKISTLVVDEKNPRGCVWMRFEGVEAAQQAQKVLHGRWFTNRQLTAEFLPEAVFAEQLPGAAPPKQHTEEAAAAAAPAPTTQEPQPQSSAPEPEQPPKPQEPPQEQVPQESKQEA